MSDGQPAQNSPHSVERARRGRLKLYLGFAAGVGKTFRLLEDAQALKQRGVDVVLGFVETRGRPETAALLAGLEAVPSRRVEFRAIQLDEMDVDVVLRRKPEVAVVDDLAHTNVPGSKHAKRYQDVLEMLDAGISVIGAFNIEHLESLNDLVERVTGIPVRETIPDAFLKQADQVVSLDLSAEDLQERLRAGKIYPPENIDAALEGFFKEANLATLRELNLREVAETLDRSAARAREEAARPRSTEGRVMVCLSSNPPRAAALLRRGSRMAGRLNTSWFCVYVETPSEAPDRIDAESQRHLLSNVEKAREMGAEPVRLRAKDPAQALLDFARSHGVGTIVVGRSLEPWWQRLVRPSVVERLLRESAGFDLYIVSFEAGDGA